MTPGRGQRIKWTPDQVRGDVYRPGDVYRHSGNTPSFRLCTVIQAISRHSGASRNPFLIPGWQMITGRGQREKWTPDQVRGDEYRQG